MNVAVAVYDVKQDAVAPASEAGPAPKRVVVGFGFWVFLLSDIVMFSALFAAYAVLVHATAGGPAGPQLFNQVSVAIQTACLLASSYTCGLMSLSVNSRRRTATYGFALVTFMLGAAFLALEIREFAGMIARGATPQTSAFLSAFFTLVGCHGLHLTAGLIWLAVMMAQVAIKGFRPTVDRRLLCFALFWHALDIIWVWLFTAVYLMGVHPLPTHPTISRLETFRFLARREGWPRRASGSTRSDWSLPSSSRPPRSGWPTPRCFGRTACPWALSCSPSPRWAFTWSSSCTSPPLQPIPTPSYP